MKEHAPIILDWENNPDFWEVTENEGPFSLDDIKYFIENSNSLEDSGQLRYMISTHSGRIIGAIDLFDFDPLSRSAGIGILIAKPEDRSKGFASDALLTLIRHSRSGHLLKQLHCIIYPSNIASIKLFSRCGFKHSGISTFKDKEVHRYSLQL